MLNLSCVLTVNFTHFKPKFMSSVATPKYMVKRMYWQFFNLRSQTNITLKMKLVLKIIYCTVLESNVNNPNITNIKQNFKFSVAEKKCISREKVSVYILADCATLVTCKKFL